MRKKEKEITDKTAMESIILRSSVCRLAMSEENRPYIVPLCFGYKDDTLYFHSAREGRKLDILGKNNKVCFEFDIDHEIVEADDACKWTMKYQSVIGVGKGSIIDDIESKRKALNIIMQNYSRNSYEYPDKTVKKIVIIKVEIEHMTGKKSGY
jgi:nitroimidazol reductase NimA-like FMN-containing flavoprotein (pyridoxamine 5'-phosphate oxidase superfamily)